LVLLTWPSGTDDPGDGQSGTPLDAAYFASQKSGIETLIHSAANPTLSPAMITDEVETARGSCASLAARLENIVDAAGQSKIVGSLTIDQVNAINALPTDLSLRQLVTEKNQANGYLGLLTGGQVALSLLGVGVAPGTVLDIDSTNSPLAAYRGAVRVQGSSNKERFEARSASSVPAPGLLCITSRGTVASPSAVQADDILGSMTVQAMYDGTGTVGSVAGTVTLNASETHSSTAQGVDLRVAVNAAGTAGPRLEVARFSPQYLEFTRGYVRFVQGAVAAETHPSYVYPPTGHAANSILGIGSPQQPRTNYFFEALPVEITGGTSHNQHAVSIQIRGKDSGSASMTPSPKVALFAAAATGSGFSTTLADHMYAANFICMISSGHNNSIGIGCEINVDNRRAHADTADPWTGGGMLVAELVLGSSGTKRLRNGLVIHTTPEAGPTYHATREYGIEVQQNTCNTHCMVLDEAVTKVTSATLLMRQLQNGQDALVITRNTDSSSTGNLIRVINQANTLEFLKLTSVGQMIVGFSTGGDIGLRTTSFGGGVGVLALANAFTNPSSVPSAGCVAYSAGGRLRTYGLYADLGVGGSLQSNLTVTGNSAGGGDTDLGSYTIPASVLVTNGHGIRVKAWFVLANNGNTKAIKIKVGSHATETIISGTYANMWVTFELLLRREGSNSQVAQMWAIIGSSAYLVSRTNYTQTESGTITFKFIGASTGANDIQQDGMLVESLG
jgi:hypothetical protein